jgi:hypothetical protein
MQDANHNNLIRPRKIVNRIPLAKRHAEIVCKLPTRGAGQRKLQQLVESTLESAEKFHRNGLGSLVRQITPDLSQV